jgi:hypothetical protein
MDDEHVHLLHKDFDFVPLPLRLYPPLLQNVPPGIIGPLAFRTLSSSRLRITLTLLRLALCLFRSSEWKAEEEEKDIVEQKRREEKS